MKTNSARAWIRRSRRYRTPLAMHGLGDQRRAVVNSTTVGGTRKVWETTYRDAVADGRVLVSVRSEDPDIVEQARRCCGGWVPSGWTTSPTEESSSTSTWRSDRDHGDRDASVIRASPDVVLVAGEDGVRSRGVREVNGEMRIGHRYSND